jgi:hypothetical protein
MSQSNMFLAEPFNSYSLVNCDACPDRRTVRLGTNQHHCIADACTVSCRQLKREAALPSANRQCAGTVRMNGISPRPSLIGGGHVNNVTRVDARDLTRAVPRYRHRSCAGSRVQLAVVGCIKIDISRAIKGGNSVRDHRRGRRTSGRKRYARVGRTSKRLELGVIGWCCELERILTV